MKLLIEKNALLVKKLWRETVSVEESEITRITINGPGEQRACAS
jgi:hypothetical protein